METNSQSDALYREAMQVLLDAGVPFLVGGAYAFGVYTGIRRRTKDIDLFVRPEHVEQAVDAFRRQGHRGERTFPHWLAKVYCEDECIDLIYRAGNGLCEVDDSWFARARSESVVGLAVQIVAPEDIIWMKAYVMERERYDGADIAHLIQSCAEKLDWAYLLRRFGPDWRLLLSYMVLFGFIYPSDKQRLPETVLADLLRWTLEDQRVPFDDRICRGTLLSRQQYLVDVEQRGFRDARLEPRSAMNAEDIAHWTAAIESDKQ